MFSTDNKIITPEVRERLNSFSEPAQKVLLATIGGLGIKEIAAVTNSTPNNVRNIRNRAFRKYQVKNSVEFAFKVFNPELYSFVKSNLKL